VLLKYYVRYGSIVGWCLVHVHRTKSTSRDYAANYRFIGFPRGGSYNNRCCNDLNLLRKLVSIAMHLNPSTNNKLGYFSRGTTITLTLAQVPHYGYSFTFTLYLESFMSRFPRLVRKRKKIQIVYFLYLSFLWPNYSLSSSVPAQQLSNKGRQRRS
jgi:hypothetical protein